MEWVTANWFWVIIFIAFVAMHLFGHGGHGGHGARRNARRGEDRDHNDPTGRVAREPSSGQHH